MSVERVPHIQKEKPLRRQAVPGQEEELLTRAAADPYSGLVDLQRMIGNSGVQRLLAQGRLQPQHAGLPLVGGLTHHLQRQCSCGCCDGDHDEREEQPEGAIAQGDHLQRFWDDDEEESSDEGGGFGDWLGETVNTIGETVGGWFGGDEEETHDSETEASGSTESADESEDGGWWDESDESESETESEGESGGGGGWWPWDSDESEDSDTVHEIPDVKAECETDEGVGFGGGSGPSIRLHGRTDANYNHGRPVPAPFPSGVTVTTRSVGSSTVFSASGTFDASFQANPTVTLPSVPGGLTPCQETAVRNFINGPLAAHEQDHVNAFTSNYNGTATLSVNVTNIIDTPEMRQRAMENPVNAEDRTRVAAANAASAALDPWNRDIPGLDCED